MSPHPRRQTAKTREEPKRMPNTDNAKSTIDTLRHLRQSRRFTDQPVPDDVINDILEVGRWTGSGLNAQPWEFVVVRDRNTLRQISEAEGKGAHLVNATFAIVVVMDGPGSAIQTFDEARLTERMMLAAAAHGLGAGIWWWKDGGAAARHILGIPEDKPLRTAISFGYPDKEASRGSSRSAPGRKPLSELVHNERY